MANMRQIKEGLEILLKYSGDAYGKNVASAGDAYGRNAVSAEHDIFYAGSVRPEEISPEDRTRLEGFGWHWDEEAECWARFC